MPDQESPRSPSPPGALDDTLDPDPDFWGPPDRPRRRPAPKVPHRLPPAGEGRAALAVIAVVIVSAALMTYRASVAPVAGGTSTATPAPTAVGSGRIRVVVNVAGAVTRPGVVRLPATDRVVDALDAAGGALASADLDRLNLAARLRDGEQVLVPVSSTTTTTATTTPLPG